MVAVGRLGCGLIRAEIDIQEAPPTSDQLTSIIEYLGPSKAGAVIKGATGSSDALRKFKANESLFERPLIVDWNNGRAGMSIGIMECFTSMLDRCVYRSP